MHRLLPLLLCILSTFMASEAATPDTSQDCRSAILIAEKFLPTLKVSNQKLIRVENMYLGSNNKIRPNLWKLTFRATNTIRSDGPIAKGGEIFIEVDLSTKKAVFLGAGE